MAERNSYGLTAALIPRPPVLLGVEGKEGNLEMKEQIDPGKKWGSIAAFFFVSQHPNVFYLAIN